nr:hypothetical protein [Pseudomonadota bacterium]
ALVILLSAPASAADDACAGVSEKCTADVTYDKTIGGTIYSCYDCKQALCKDGGNGGLSGTKTSSVCTEKATTFQPIQIDDLVRGNDRMAPKPRPSPRPGNDQRTRSTNQDVEAAPESPVQDHRKGGGRGRVPPPPEAGQDSGDDHENAGPTGRNSNAVGTRQFDEADAPFGTRTDVKPAQPVATSAAPAPERKSKPPLRPRPTPSAPIPIPYPSATGDAP